MPSSSMRLTSVASVKRGGGSVKCCLASMPRSFSASPWASGGRRRLSSSSVSSALPLRGPVVAAFLVEPQEAVEQHDRARRAQAVGLAVAARHRDLGGGLLELGGRHLARHGALPDQLVEAGLVALDVAGNVLGLAPHVGGADRLVRFLGVLGLGLVLADEGRQVALGIVALHQLADLGDRLGDDRDAVGSHVGDEAGHLAVELDALVEALGHLHGLLGGEAELARGLLLQGGGGEGGVGVAPHRLLLDRGDGERAALDGGLDGVGGRPRP